MSASPEQIVETGNRSSCQCEGCQSACANKPGWFKSGEVEKVAEFLGVSLSELFKQHIAVDWWQGGWEDGDKDYRPDDSNIFTLSPALVGAGSGTEMPYDNRGACVFFKDGKCSIHPVKPFECREMIHNEEDNQSRHKETAMDWKKHQKQIEELLGRKPEAATGSPWSLW